jgi:hypothetical protein
MSALLRWAKRLGWIPFAIGAAALGFYYWRKFKGDKSKAVDKLAVNGADLTGGAGYT